MSRNHVDHADIDRFAAEPIDPNFHRLRDLQQR